MSKTDNLIFLSYASPDKERVLRFYKPLKSDGFNVWIDCEDLLPGQNWDFEIKRVLEKSVVILIFISKNSFGKRGYVQKEIKIALDKLSEMLVDDIYIVPILLDSDTPLPEQLNHIQSISASDRDCHERIKISIKYQLDRLGKTSRDVQRKEDVYWTYEKKSESWDGMPGYSVELQIPNFQSSKYSNLSDITDYIKGQFIGQLIEHRSTKLSQMSGTYNYGQNKFYRTSTYDAHCREPIIRGKVLSIQYSVHWYGAGAAHPNLHFSTFNFVLEPLVFIPNLFSIFSNPKDALPVMQNAIRKQLYDKLIKGDASEGDANLTKARIDKGTNDWKSFHSFIFNLDGIEVMFPPYEVASYADGAHFTKIPYEELVNFMRPEYRAALLLSSR